MSSKGRSRAKSTKRCRACGASASHRAPALRWALPVPRRRFGKSRRSMDRTFLPSRRSSCHCRSCAAVLQGTATAGYRAAHLDQPKQARSNRQPIHSAPVRAGHFWRSGCQMLAAGVALLPSPPHFSHACERHCSVPAPGVRRHQPCQ